MWNKLNSSKVEGMRLEVWSGNVSFLYSICGVFELWPLIYPWSMYFEWGTWGKIVLSRGLVKVAGMSRRFWTRPLGSLITESGSPVKSESSFISWFYSQTEKSGNKYPSRNLGFHLRFFESVGASTRRHPVGAADFVCSKDGHNLDLLRRQLKECETNWIPRR